MKWRFSEGKRRHRNGAPARRQPKERNAAQLKGNNTKIRLITTRENVIIINIISNIIVISSNNNE